MYVEAVQEVAPCWNTTLQCCCRPDSNPLPRMCQARRKAHKFGPHATDKKSLVPGEAKKNSLKLTEQCRNLYENKASPFRIRGRSWNVYENTGVNRWLVLTERREVAKSWRAFRPLAIFRPRTQGVQRRVTSWSFENRPMPVIPAKAGIHPADILKSAAYGLDSRFRGNNRYFGLDTIPNDTGNANLNRSPAYAAQ